MTRAALAVVTGTAFSAATAIQDYARKREWAAPVLRYVDFSTLEAKFGRYERARTFLDRARNLVRSDEVLVTLDASLANLEAFRAKEISRYFQSYPPSEIALLDQEFRYQETKAGIAPPISETDCDANCYGKDERALYDRVLLEARLDRESGDYEAAILKYTDARRIAELAELKQDYRRAANEGIVWARQLRASWQEIQNPGISAGWQGYNKIRRNDMVAARAEMLAAHLSEAGLGRAAIPYLEEARSIYQKTDPKREPYVLEEIARLTANETANAMGKTVGGRPLTIYTNSMSQIEIVFDAIEYGKGDWNRSVSYLKVALSADPENRKLIGALNYVKGLSVE